MSGLGGPFGMGVLWQGPKTLARVMSICGKWVIALPMIVLLALRSAPARAEIDANSFLKQYDAAPPSEKSQYEDVALNMHIGIGWAESMVEKLSGNNTPLYCQPAGVTLTGEKVIQNVRQFVTSKPEFGKNPLGLVVLFSDMHLWACPKK